MVPEGGAEFNGHFLPAGVSTHSIRYITDLLNLPSYRALWACPHG